MTIVTAPPQDRHPHHPHLGAVDAQVGPVPAIFRASEATAKFSRSNPDWLKTAEWVLASLLTTTLLYLLFVRATHAGALWRDECAVVQLANSPSVSDIFRNFPHEAFPPLFHLTIRGYTALFGTTDGALRAFGFCVGALLVGAFWINARLFRKDVPLVALSLLSLSTTFLVWGTTIRGYGLGAMLIVLAFGSIGRLLLKPTPTQIIAAFFFSVASVQTLLHNGALIPAIAGAAIVVCLFKRDLPRTLLVSAVCATSLLLFLPYVDAYSRARDWNIIVRGMPTLSSLFGELEMAWGSAIYAIPSIWYVVATSLIGLALWRLTTLRRSKSEPQWTLMWFGLLVLLIATVAYYVFLRVLSYTPNPWYYLAFICIMASALDLLAANLCTIASLRWIRLTLAAAAISLAPFASWQEITERQTDVDFVARTLETQAASSDLIVVSPWQIGIPFHYYYRGTTPWITLPSITDHQIHRYDLLKAKMLSSTPIDDVTQIIQSTLEAGHRVWFVGGLKIPRGDEPVFLPPAPKSTYKWDSRAYTLSWWQQISARVLAHANRADPVAISRPRYVQVNRLETTPLAVASGWHE
ncbi:MAG: hypothetical protein ABI925_02105 [Verrucomicrobiota bacterium]